MNEALQAAIGETLVMKTARDGWKAFTDVQMGKAVQDGKEGERVLRINTYKTSDGRLRTASTVHFREDGFLTHRMFSDFSRVELIQEGRCTQKAVATQQSLVMVGIEQIFKAANEWYKNTEQPLKAA